jgi:hypothetical protein
MDHSASRTFFLWFVSIERSTPIFIQQTYKKIHRTKIRRFKETGNRSLLLEKAQRSDVVSGEAKLSEQEQTQLDALKRIQHRLKCAELRYDRLLMVLRDY